MASAYSALHLDIKFTSLSPVIDNPTFHLDYFTTFVTQDLTDVANLATTVGASFNAIPTGATAAPNNYLSPILSRNTNATMIDVYDVSNNLNGSPAGSPVLISSFTLGGSPSVQPSPEGCAAVITLQAPYGTDVEFAPGTRPRGRDRGRIYFGPLAGVVFVNEITTHRTTLWGTTQADLLKWIKAINLVTTSSHSVLYTLGVWSRKNASMKALQQAWMDDRPDYVRMRADQGANRTYQSLP